MKHSPSLRSGRAPGVAVAVLAAAAVAALPGAAAAADPASTIRATVDSNGAVTKAQQLSADGAVSDFGGQLPITMSISRSSSDGAQTYSYKVENTSSQLQTVTYDDTAGNTRKTSIQLQLPLVAQLGVDVPKSAGDVTADGATVSTSADGTRHLLWQMVLFTPLGSAVQTVSFTTADAAAPVAELRATAVDPTTAPGLSSASQSASAGYQQDDFWAGYAHGANDGLSKLYDGSGELTTGLGTAQSGAQQLHDGLADALSGTQQAADGSTQLYDGSAQIAAGLKKAQAGADKLLAGLGNDKQSDTVVGGIKAVSDGLAALNVAFTGDGTAANPGITFGIGCAVDGLDLIVNGNATAVADPCFATLGGTKPALPALSTIAGTGIYNVILSALLTQALIPLSDGLTGEVAPGIAQLAAGAAQLHTALKKQFAPGLAKLDDGLGQLLDGSRQVRGGLHQLSDGLVTGAAQFPAAVDGAGDLADGLGDAVDGSQQVHDGVGQVQSDAVAPLEKQLKQASANGHRQLAVLAAAGALAANGPGGAGATYVLTQHAQDVALAADSDGGSHTGRNVGIGVGGAALLLVGLGSGFAMGRSRRRVAA